MNKIAVILDAAHGVRVGEKYLEVDRVKVNEGKFCRKIKAGVIEQLNKLGINYYQPNNSIIDLPIIKRIENINGVIQNHPNTKFILVSLHGAVFESFTWGCVSNSKNFNGEVVEGSEAGMLADIYCSFAADMLNLPIKRLYIDEVRDYLKYAIIEKVNCPAILTENKVNKDIKTVHTDDDIDLLVKFHVKAITAAIRHYE